MKNRVPIPVFPMKTVPADRSILHRVGTGCPLPRWQYGGSTSPIVPGRTRGRCPGAHARMWKEAHLAKPAKRKPNAQIMAPLTPSASLAEVVGAKALPRTEVTKKIWQYIKRNGLQDKKNGRMINADEKLNAVFGGKKQVSMFEMTKLISK